MGATGCAVDSAKNHYILAEKLWGDRNYSAAVAEFEKVINKDPRGVLGQQALYRAAMTQSLFLNQYSDAVLKLRRFSQNNSDAVATHSAQVQIGELLYSHLEQYDQAISHYRSLLKSDPLFPESPSFLYRVGKSHFFLFQFNDALQAYAEVIAKFPTSLWAEKSYFELGMTYFTRGESQLEGSSRGGLDFQRAIEAFQKLIRLFPKSGLVPEARFGIASCKEELDQLDVAYRMYAELKTSFPSPQVIEIKLNRIRERLSHRSANR